MWLLPHSPRIITTIFLGNYGFGCSHQSTGENLEALRYLIMAEAGCSPHLLNSSSFHAVFLAACISCILSCCTHAPSPLSRLLGLLSPLSLSSLSAPRKLYSSLKISLKPCPLKPSLNPPHPNSGLRDPSSAQPSLPVSYSMIVLLTSPRRRWTP